MATRKRFSRGDLDSMDDLDRKSRAARRRRTAILNRASLGRIEQDPTPLFGLAAVSLVQQLTRECWALAGKETPGYSRANTSNAERVYRALADFGAPLGAFQVKAEEDLADIQAIEPKQD
jgi:hypothetical protein